MPPSALPNASYIPLSSSLSHGNRARRATAAPTRSATSTSQRPNSLGARYEAFFRVAAFIVLESGFIILTSLALAKPIPLQVVLTFTNATLAEAKGGATIISVIWHALAIMIVKDILLCIFSAEWEAQYRRSGVVIPGVTDIVSRMTAGFIAQLQHFASIRATLAYRLAFISTILLMLVNGLGPSAITISPVSLEQPLNIQVANLTLKRSFWESGSPSLLVVDRANLITRLEQLEDTSYGFRTQGEENILIPWPASNLISANGPIKYESEIITYDFDCSWIPPSRRGTAFEWIADRKNWTIYRGLLDLEDVYGSATILPMGQRLLSRSDPYSYLIAFFFLGTKVTPSGVQPILNLEGLPTIDISSSPDVFLPTLATILLCDPHIAILPATVTLSQGNLSALPQTGPPKTGNIPQTAADAIFSQALFDATSISMRDGVGLTVNAISRNLFLTDPTLDYNKHPSGISPLPLDQINANLNTAIRSAAKAYLSGYRPNDDNPVFPSFEMIPTEGTVTEDTLALVGSKPFLIALIVVVCLLMVLLIALLVLVKFDELQTFDLENVTKTLHVP